MVRVLTLTKSLKSARKSDFEKCYSEKSVNQKCHHFFRKSRMFRNPTNAYFFLQCVQVASSINLRANSENPWLQHLAETFFIVLFPSIMSSTVLSSTSSHSFLLISLLIIVLPLFTILYQYFHFFSFLYSFSDSHFHYFSISACSRWSPGGGSGGGGEGEEGGGRGGNQATDTKKLARG